MRGISAAAGTEPADFATIGDRMFKRAHGLSAVVRKRRFRALFGISAQVCAETWKKLPASVLQDAHPKHLMWALLLLKVYAVERSDGTRVCPVHRLSALFLRRWHRLPNQKIVAFQFLLVFAQVQSSFRAAPSTSLNKSAIRDGQWENQIVPRPVTCIPSQPITTRVLFLCRDESAPSPVRV
eukprot:IDg2996t1